jgi:hypothetical protein
VPLIQHNYEFKVSPIESKTCDNRLTDLEDGQKLSIFWGTDELDRESGLKPNLEANKSGRRTDLANSTLRRFNHII